eukprot:1380179-Amorphochlora_amoeboformis.AAC.1
MTIDNFVCWSQTSFLPPEPMGSVDSGLLGFRSLKLPFCLRNPWVPWILGCLGSEAFYGPLVGSILLSA